jgi:predicted phosphoribosyltransferase
VSVGVPVGARATCDELAQLADALVCVEVPVNFYAVGQWYEDFTQTTDAEITRLLGTHL